MRSTLLLSLLVCAATATALPIGQSISIARPSLGVDETRRVSRFLMQNPELLPKTALSQRDATVDLVNHDSVDYTGTVSFGTPAQAKTMIFDTGSSDLWVSSSSCTITGGRQACQSSAAGFHTSSSSTFRQGGGSSTSITYGSGKVYISPVQDTVSVAGLTLRNAAFSLGYQQDSDGQLSSYEAGIAGLAYNSLSSTSAQPLLDQLVAANEISFNGFGMLITSSTSGSRQGILTLGGVDSMYSSADFTYTPITHQAWYQISVQSAAMVSSTGSSLGTLSTSFDAIVDSGTSCLVVPSDVNDQIASVINSFGLLQDCSNIDQAPSFVFTIGGKQITVSPHDYIITAGGDCQLCVSASGSGSSSNSGPQWILGDSFMRSQYVLFDRQNTRIGFADLITSDVSDDTSGTTAPTALTAGDVFGIVFGVLAAVGIAAAVVFFVVRHRQQRAAAATTIAVSSKPSTLKEPLMASEAPAAGGPSVFASV